MKNLRKFNEDRFIENEKAARAPIARLYFKLFVKTGFQLELLTQLEVLVLMNLTNYLIKMMKDLIIYQMNLIGTLLNLNYINIILYHLISN